MVRYTKDEITQMLKPMVVKFYDTLDKVKEQLLKCAYNGAFTLGSVESAIDDLQMINTDMNNLLDKFMTTKDTFTGAEKMQALKETIESLGKK